MNGNSSKDPFDLFTEKNVGRTVKNITSDMWEPISTSTPQQRQRNTKKPDPQVQRPTSEGKSKKAPSDAGKKKIDATKDRISEGGKKPQKKSSKTQSKETKTKKTKSEKISFDKKTASKKNRKPKGRDTRNVADIRQKSAENKRNKDIQRAAKSRLEYNEDRRSGRSHDDISKARTKKKLRRRKLVTLITVFAVILFVSAFVGVYAYTKGAPIQYINIVGESSYKNEEIIEKANVYIGLNMLSVREKKVNSSVTKALPYIHQVDVEYQLPDTLTLTVTPSQESILIKNGSGYICVDEYDKVLSLKKKKLTDGRYRVEGMEKQTAQLGEDFAPTEKNEERYEAAKKIVSAARELKGFEKGVIDVTSINNIQFTYDGRIRIYLGEGENIPSQLELAMQVIENSANDGQTGYIDLRYGDKAYLALGGMQAD